MDTKELAMTLYDTYCVAVGGVAYNRDKLPNSEEFFKDPNKQVQVQAWIRVAETSVKEVISNLKTRYE